MSSRRIKAGVAGLMCVCLLFLGACEPKEKETVQQAKKQQKEETTPKYTFRDVLGQEYQAELLLDVPKCTYEASRFIEEGGYKYYTDESGVRSSRLGIDVSEYQQQADWNAVKGAGMEFVMVRVGYRGYGKEGTLVEDAMFRQHIEGALSAGLEVGVYFFSQAVSKEETLEEVDFVCSRIRDYKITCPVVFDTEEIKNDEARTDNLDARQFTDNCITFCDGIEQAGYQSMIYANMKWMAFTLDLERLKGYEKWYADYEPRPQCPYDFRMWQYTETGSVPGMEGNVDINVMFPKG